MFYAAHVVVGRRGGAGCRLPRQKFLREEGRIVKGALQTDSRYIFWRCPSRVLEGRNGNV